MQIYRPDENGNATGIEWTKAPGCVAGATWNPTGGCFHNCRFMMPDGSIVGCYAKALANRFSAHYQYGFRHHYWHPQRLNEPGNKKEPLGIFVGSMADVYGHWVDNDEISAILLTCKDAQQHTFFTLTKNPKRMVHFDIPENVWSGCSLPGGNVIGETNGMNSLWKYVDIMNTVRSSVRWFSFEPLWFDAADVLRRYIETGLSLPIDWMVIGAASNGRTIYQPKKEWVQGLLDIADEHGIPVFMKYNLDWPERRMEFPEVDHVQAIQRKFDF